MKQFALTSLWLSVMFILSSNIFPQQEMPGDIKELIAAGINSLDNAKVPSDIDQAVSVFMEAVKKEPGYADAHYYLGKTLSMLEGNARNAIREFRKYLELYPAAPDKEEVSKEISSLEDVIKTGRKSSLAGIELVELSNGIYVKKVFNEDLKDMLNRLEGSQLHEGDKLLKVNTADISGMPLQQVLDMISSRISDTLTVEIFRVNKVMTMNLVKKPVTGTLRELGEDDLNEIIKESKTLLCVFWEADSGSNHEYSGDRIKLSFYNERIQIITADILRNKFIAEEFNIDKSMIPAVSIYKDKALLKQINGYDPALLYQTVEKELGPAEKTVNTKKTNIKMLNELELIKSKNKNP